jgi:hypothetical protein
VEKRRGSSTHCESLPFCDIVIMILSAKEREDASVVVPSTRAAACLQFAGKGEFSMPPKERLWISCARSIDACAMTSV